MKRPLHWNDAWVRYGLLTPTERGILIQLALGGTVKEIAADLKVSPKMPQWHRTNIYRKLGLHRPIYLTFFCLHLDLIKLPQLYV